MTRSLNYLLTTEVDIKIYARNPLGYSNQREPLFLCPNTTL